MEEQVILKKPERGVGKLDRIKCLNALHLKIIACALMLCDHIWLSLMEGHEWMTCVGRLAFPIFAFQIAEGFCRTHDFKKYFLRMLIFALISEIPFNLMNGGAPIYLMHQNVMFTFCLALLCMYVLKKAKEKGTWVFLLSSLGVLAVSFVVGAFSMVDYGGYGIWMVLLFYFTRDILFGWLIQLVGMIYINGFMIGGESFPIQLFSRTFYFPEQTFAVLALLILWLYNGKPGPKNKKIQYACYAFYPVHMLILALIALALRQ